MLILNNGVGPHQGNELCMLDNDDDKSISSDSPQDILSG